MAMSSKINVYFRKKPYTCLSNDDKDIINFTKTSINIQNCKKRLHERAYFSSYKNLNIIGDNQLNLDVYNTTVKDDIEGLRPNLLIAYGQTGSGKTHTLIGTPNEMGLIPLAVKNLVDKGLSIKLSVLEIYNDNIYDLITDTKHRLFVYEVNKRIKYKQPPANIIVSSREQLNDIITNINSKRVVGSTKLNDYSSRAHTIYFFTCVSNNFKFFAIDLAGNERGTLTNAKGFKQNQEYISINKSLFALKECIRSIYLSKEYIPYRRSKLTILLREILYNNINIHFIGTINSSKMCYPDIIDTIEYGVCLKKSNIKKIIRNNIKSSPPEPEYKLDGEYLPNINISIKDLSKTYQRNDNYSTGDALIKRCQSAPTQRVTDNNSLENYYKFILHYYEFARKHARIYKFLKNTNGEIKGDKSEDIRTLINKFSFENMKFIDKFL